MEIVFFRQQQSIDKDLRTDCRYGDLVTNGRRSLL